MVKKIYFPEIASTNDYASENIGSIEDRTVIFADIQTKGRGRNGRHWFSGKNNLSASLILKPQLNFSQVYKVNALVHYTAVVLARVFKKEYSIETRIKWPNDLMAGFKKIAGILIETVITGESLQGVIIGTGVNLNLDEKSLKKIGRPATSLNVLLGKEVNRDEFLDLFLKEFFLQYDELLMQGFSLIKEEYKLKSMTLGRAVKAAISGKEYSGIAKDIDDMGQLVLDCNNEEKIINTGDITC
ncbi:MAG: biotin--[acetyl-CoA-carboxylase] ligase [Actinobacteria bacterium]|nr:biotin--[acetyl-CoA-carboxylase] ligase [Actinomycetota bacterium]